MFKFLISIILKKYVSLIDSIKAAPTRLENNSKVQINRLVVVVKKNKSSELIATKKPKVNISFLPIVCQLECRLVVQLIKKE